MKALIALVLLAVFGCASVENQKPVHTEAGWPSQEKVRVANLFNEAIFHYQAGRFAETMAISKKIQTVEAPDDPNYKWEAEQLYHRAKQRSCQETLSRRPADPEAKKCLAEVYEKFPQWKEAK